jgi:hypothetical protein
MIPLTDQDILLRLANTEDSFVERKTVNDTRDCLKTVVAFANTAPVGYPALLFVGVRDNGEPEGTTSDLDKIQQRLSDKIGEAYPSIYTLTRVLSVDGRQFLAVIVPGSADRPHFAGPAYIRDGSKSPIASEAQFNKLIAERSGQTYEILSWRNKIVTLTEAPRTFMLHGSTQWATPKQTAVTVFDCNLHYVTLASVSQANQFASFPLRVIELNYDNPRNRLELRILDGPMPPWV